MPKKNRTISVRMPASIIFDPKKDGSVRFCADYQKLSAVTVRDSYPLPRMDEYMDSLGDATVITTIDKHSWYWKIEVKEADREKTSFVS